MPALVRHACETPLNIPLDMEKCASPGGLIETRKSPWKAAFSPFSDWVYSTSKSFRFRNAFVKRSDNLCVAGLLCLIRRRSKLCSLDPNLVELLINLAAPLLPLFDMGEALAQFLQLLLDGGDVALCADTLKVPLDAVLA